LRVDVVALYSTNYRFHWKALFCYELGNMANRRNEYFSRMIRTLDSSL